MPAKTPFLRLTFALKNQPSFEMCTITRSNRVDRAALVQLISAHLSKKEPMVAEVVDATLEEIYAALKRGECVSLKNFGAFYVRPERESWVFKFNPSQRLRALFGWSSTYKGDL